MLHPFVILCLTRWRISNNQFTPLYLKQVLQCSRFKQAWEEMVSRIIKKYIKMRKLRGVVYCSFSWTAICFSVSAEVLWESWGNNTLAEITQGAMRHMFINNCCLGFKLFHKISPRSHIALHSHKIYIKYR